MDVGGVFLMVVAPIGDTLLKIQDFFELPPGAEFAP